MKEGLGKLNLIYMSTFDGIELLDLKPKEFETLRKNTYQVSLDNPQVFREFFNLSPINFPTSEDLNQKGAQSLIFNIGSPPKVQPSKLLRGMSSDDFLATPMVSIKNIRSRHFSFLETVPLSRNPSENSHVYEAQQQSFSEPPEENDSSQNRFQDFEYSGTGIFFKADLLVYEQVII